MTVCDQAAHFKQVEGLAGAACCGVTVCFAGITKSSALMSRIRRLYDTNKPTHAVSIHSKNSEAISKKLKWSHMISAMPTHVAYRHIMFRVLFNLFLG